MNSELKIYHELFSLHYQLAYPEMLWVCPLAKEVLDSPENTTDTIGSTVATKLEETFRSTVATQIQIPTDS